VRVAVVIGNPGHHTAMLEPVIRLLARDHAVEVLSVCEFRGLATPTVDGIAVHALFPGGVRRSIAAGAHTGRASDRLLRRLADELLWKTTMGPRLRWLLRTRPEVALLPNDVAYRYNRIRRQLEKGGTCVVLVQEGIRFPVPSEAAAGAAYGSGGCARICAWGEASADHFAATGVAHDAIAVTGTPRFDAFDVERERAAAGSLRERYGLGARVIAYLSKPIDDQGFVITAEKLELFRAFVVEVGPLLDRRDATLAVELHPREDASAFAAVAASTAHAGRVRVLDGAPLHPLLAASQAAGVLSSTVGLEALMFGVPLGVVSLPGHGTIHDYVSAGAASALMPGNVGAGPSTSARRAYVERHLAYRGSSAAKIAELSLSLSTSANRSAA
jgi:hypothetical protein